MNITLQPLVSVVIPSFNHAHFLPRALKSVHRQTWKNWEIVVVDNHSSDDTDQVLKAWRSERVRVLKVHNQGVIAVSRNKGIRKARGDWIAFLDSDDWWDEDKLHSSMKLALNGADVVYHDLTMVAADGKSWPWRRSRSRRLSSGAYMDMIDNGCALPNSSVVARKSSLLGIGGLREDKELVGWEDFDTWLRLAKIGSRFARLRGSHGYYWVGGGSVSNPARTLSNIESFLVQHVIKGASVPWWCHYSRAVAYRALGQQESVGPSFVAAWRARPSLINRLRIACKWLMTR